jgi:MFS family permease
MLAGIAYYLGLAFVTGPILLLALQLLNAWSFAGISGIGLPLFQQMIPRPGLSTGLYMNTRRVGSIVSGPIIAIGSLTALEQRGIFLTCAALTVVGMIIIAIASRTTKPRRSTTTADSQTDRHRGPQTPDLHGQTPTMRSTPGHEPRARPLHLKRLGVKGSRVQISPGRQ